VVSLVEVDFRPTLYIVYFPHILATIEVGVKALHIVGR